MKNPRFTSQMQTTFSSCIFVAEGGRPLSIILQVEAKVDTTSPARMGVAADGGGEGLWRWERPV